MLLQGRRPGFDPYAGKIPGGGHGNPFHYSCLENPHGQMRLAGYSPWGHKESDTTEQFRRWKRCRLNPWRRKWQPTPIFLPGRFHGQKSLAGYNLWGHKESDTKEQLSTLFVYLYKMLIVNIEWVFMIYQHIQESFRKTSISALLTMPKPFTVWITVNCGNSERNGNTRPPDLPLEKSVCRSGRNS